MLWDLPSRACIFLEHGIRILMPCPVTSWMRASHFRPAHVTTLISAKPFWDLLMNYVAKEGAGHWALSPVLAVTLHPRVHQTIALLLWLIPDRKHSVQKINPPAFERQETGLRLCFHWLCTSLWKTFDVMTCCIIKTGPKWPEPRKKHPPPIPYSYFSTQSVIPLIALIYLFFG